MKSANAAVLMIAALASLPAWADNSEISANGSRRSAIGPAANFTGTVMVEPLFGERPGITATGGQVIFAPGARSAWHTHPRGQILIVTAGSGWVQRWDGARQEMKPGDVVWIPPGVKHWHGATATTPVTHFAIQEHEDGKVVDWLEKVSDEQYGK